jgi:organic radical activating enzyme
MKLNLSTLNEGKTFCILPFIHQEKKFNGTYHICCYGDQLQSGPNEVCNSSLENFNSSKMKELRYSMVNNIRNSACSSCYSQEDQGMVSPRIRENTSWLKWHSTHDAIERCLDNYSSQQLMHPISYDLRYSNTCTLKCRMCNSSSSSAINAEYKKLTDKWPEKFWTVSNHKINHEVDLHSDIQKIYLAGGEPLVENLNLHLLEQVANFNDKITILINTSLNVVNDKFFNLLNRFKYLTLVVSIDGTNNVNDYIRHGSNFEIVKENIKKFSNHDIMFSTCVSMYNIFNLKDLVNFINLEFSKYSVNHSINIVNDIEELFIENVPYDLRPKLITDLKHTLTLANEFPAVGIKNCISILEQNNFQQEKFGNFIRYTRLLDQNRNESITTVVPQLSKYFNGQS